MGDLLVRAAGGLHWDAGQSGGPVEQVGAVWSLLDELWSSLNRRGDTNQSVTELHLSITSSLVHTRG